MQFCKENEKSDTSSELKLNFATWNSTSEAAQIYCGVKLSKAIKLLNINLKQATFPKEQLTKCVSASIYKSET